MTQSAETTHVPRDSGLGALQPSARSRPVDAGRLGVYAALGGSLASVPIPWLPDSLARRVRGALVHDVAARHGLSLTREARDVLAEPSGPDGPRGLLAQAVRFIGVRVALRVFTGPIAVVWPLRQALGTYLLGHLFDRYLDQARTERAVRIDVEEARRVRLAVDRAVLRALTVMAPPMNEPPLIDDQRDTADVIVDSVLSAAAGLPAKAIRKLEAAFDELLAQSHG